MTVKVSPVATNNSERRGNQTFTPETVVGLTVKSYAIKFCTNMKSNGFRI